MYPFPCTAEALKVPPRNSILGADDGGFGPQHELRLRRQLRQAVRFNAPQDGRRWSPFFKRANNSGLDLEISLSTLHLHAMRLHGFQVRPAREDRDIEPSLRH